MTGRIDAKLKALGIDLPDPRRLQALGVPLARIREIVRSSNLDVGGRTVELAETEFMVRGRGYIKSLADLEQIDVLGDDQAVHVEPGSDFLVVALHATDFHLDGLDLAVGVDLEYPGRRAFMQDGGSGNDQRLALAQGQRSGHF